MLAWLNMVVVFRRISKIRTAVAGIPRLMIRADL